ncbi:MAG: ATP-binding cassette domain-containing protein [Bacteroidetes bacterium]|nr:MAG: ATP-binding cassette domain-containing protein [Bacteroidota bacterium]
MTEISIPEKKPKKTWQQLKPIFAFILPYKWKMIIGLLFLMCSIVTSLTIPVLSGKFLDVAIGKKDIFFGSITQVGVWFAVVLIIQAFFSFFIIFLFSQVSERAMGYIRTKLYAKILTLPFTFFEKRRVGELNSRLSTDVTQLQDTVSFSLAEFIRQILTIIVGTIYLFIQSTQLTLFMVMIFPVLVILAIIFGKYIRKMAKKTQDELATANVIVEETFQSIQAVKSFTNENWEKNRYQSTMKNVVNQALKVAIFRGFFTSFVIAILFGGLVLVLGYGATLVSEGKMSVGDLTTFIIFSAFIGGSLGGTSELYGQLQKSLGASERILEILEEESEYTPNENIKNEQNNNITIENIEFKNVHFSYPTRTDVKVLDGLNLSIQGGQKIAIVGASGVGKSTTMQLLSRYYDIQEGEITINQKNIKDFDLIHLRKNIGLVPQEILLFGGTIRENIQYGKPNATENEIIEAAEKAYAMQFIKEFPEKLDTIVGERGVKLSGGQKQRIAIARAILKNPTILILDEATSSLDAESEKWVQLALEVLMKNRTTIIIAHRLATIKQADKIYVLESGKSAEFGTHEDLLKKENGIYHKLVHLQAQGSRL